MFVGVIVCLILPWPESSAQKRRRQAERHRRDYDRWMRNRNVIVDETED